MCQKRSFLSLLENSVINFFRSLSIIFAVFCANLVPEIWAKMLLTNQIVVSLYWLYLQNKMMKKSDFLHIDANSQKLSLKNVSVGAVKNWCGHYSLRTLKETVSQEGINIVSWFLVCYENSEKLKVTLTICA